MTVHVNDSGTWKNPQVYVNDGGTWKEPTEIYVYDGGWKLTYKRVTVSASTQNISIHSLMGSPTYPVTAVVNIDGGLTIGSSSTSTPAITTSGIPAGSILYLTIGSGTYVVGKGGVGGNAIPGSSGSSNVKAGTAGGTALYTRITTYLTNNGTIGGGGGGGGGGGVTNGSGQAYDDYTGAGGGGAGNAVGAGGSTAGNLSNVGGSGTLTTGGSGSAWQSSGGSSEQQTGSYGGNGGNLGSAGSNGTPYQTHNVGGAAGYAIDGVSYITKKTAGTITGSEVN